jgi:6-pyruvoyltetrahydropterin/6-carboxytetrahydropterin synthase
VSKDYLVFCAAHFITYRGHRCESLHGHNYRASFVIEGSVDENWYVVDFGVVKRLGRELVGELDHRMLLPRDSERIAVTREGTSVEARYLDRRYVFPAEDVVLLPVPNTTAEMIARYLAGRMVERLAAEDDVDLSSLRSVEVEVEESFGQSARFRRVSQA